MTNLQKLLKMNNSIISNIDLLNIRHLHDYVGLETIKELDNNTRLVLIELVNNNFLVVKVTKL